MTNTTLDLLAAIRDQPDDNILRLAYADHIQNLDTESKACPRCAHLPESEREQFRRGGFKGRDMCMVCEDTLFVPNTSNADRAEFIRVQVELARHPLCTSCNGDGRLDADHRPGTIECWLCWGKGSPTANIVREVTRERELRTANEAAWRRGPVCKMCLGGGYIPTDRDDNTCEVCHGTGDAGGLMRRASDPDVTHSHNGWANTVTYHRGMKRVECRAADVWREVPDHDNNCRCWVPTPWALVVCKHHPDVVEFQITDKTSAGLPHPNDKKGRWYRGGNSVNAVPEPVFDLLRGTSATWQPYPKEYPTVDEANLDMWRWVVRWVHKHLKTAYKVASSASSTS